MNDQPKLTAEEYFERAVKRDQKWDFVGAIQDFTAAIELRPDWTEAYWGRANARHNAGDYMGELHDVEEIIRLEPENERAKDWHTMILSSPKSPEDALNQLLSQADSIAANPNMIKAYVFALQKYAQAMPDRADETKNVIERITTPKSEIGFMTRGAYFQSTNDRQKAVEAYTEAIQLNPERAEAYLQRANAYGGFGHFEEALADYTCVLELYSLRSENPFNVASVYLARGTLRGYTGDLDGAIDDLSQSINLRADNAEAYFHRAEFREEKQDFEEAIAGYTKVIEYGHVGDSLSRQEIAFVNRGRLREDQGDLAGAIADWEAYLALGGGEKFNDRAEIEGWIAEVEAKLTSDK